MQKKWIEEQITFMKPNAQDIVKFAPLIDELIDKVNINNTYRKAEKNGINKDDVEIVRTKEAISLLQGENHHIDEKYILDTLIELGFVGTGIIDLLPEGYPYKNGKIVTIEITDAGQIQLKIQVIKVIKSFIKDSSLKEINDLLQNMPAKITNVKKDEAEDFIRHLKDAGAEAHIC